jgi:hypothetical protein
VHGFGRNVPQALKSFWVHQMELQGDVVQIEGCIGLFGGSENLDAR